MSTPHRLFALVGGGAAAALIGFAGPTALGHAAGADDVPLETCDGAVCLVMSQPDQTEWLYRGIRPFFTNWTNDSQQYTVQVAQGDGSSIDAGSYSMRIDDSWSPFASVYQYHYGDFVPTDAGKELDPGALGWFGDLSGASVYNVSLFGGALSQLSINDVGPHDVSYFVVSTPTFTNTLITGTGASADYIQFGDSAPIFLWNSLFHGGFAEAQVPDFFLPADPFTGIDFDPADYWNWDIPGL